MDLSTLAPKREGITLEVWLVAIGAITALAVVPMIGVSIIPCMSHKNYQRLMVYFVGLGVGSLTGNAVFNLIPGAYNVIDDAYHQYILHSWTILFGLYLFFFTDKFVSFYNAYKNRQKTILKESEDKIECNNLLRNNDSSTQNQLEKQLVVTEKFEDDTKRLNVPKIEISLPRNDTDDQINYISHDLHDATATIIDTFDGEKAKEPNGTVDAHKHSFGTKGFDIKPVKGKKVIATVAWMIIFGDGLHRVIDGLTIGAVFAESIASGISVSLAILCEEIPHVLGDIAILVNAGLSMKRALIYNALSHILSYLGLVIGLYAGQQQAIATYVFGIAAGMFLYVALVSMIPEMNRTMERKMEKNYKSALIVFLLQTAGAFTGIMVVFIMALFGEKIENLL